MISMDEVKLLGLKYPYFELEFEFEFGGDCAMTGRDDIATIMQRKQRIRKDELLWNFGAMRVVKVWRERMVNLGRGGD
jgi:hypothetical protein